MRAPSAARGAAIVVLLLAVAASAAGASPADVEVRIEGAGATIFDRVVHVDGHDVRASSDTQARHCDGTNAHRNPTPEPSATSAAVDALASIGQGFDGQWYPGFDDYYVSRLGPESEDSDKLWWWGVLVNRVFSSVGGCQAQVHSGDEVLWVLDAFGNRPFLWLAEPASTPVGQAPTVLVGQPLAVRVTATTSSTGHDQTSGPPYAGATVDGVDANGQPTTAGTVDDAVSGADGTASVVFHHAGWQRLKARNPGAGDHPLAIASNSIEVCVEATPGAGCDGTPPSDRPVEPKGGRDPARPADDRVRLGRPRLSLDRAHGRIDARWKVLDTGPGMRDWTIASRTLGQRGARFVARGGGGPSTARALLRLPTGVTSQVRLSVRDTAGHTSSLSLGRVLVPRDDHTLQVGGDWMRASDRGAWMATVTRGAAGAQLALRLGPGRPAFVVRSGHASARVEVRAGPHVSLYAIAGGSAPQTRQLLGPRRTQAGTVELKVLSGSVSVDGVGLAP
jgi:hypothetical protein